jgi:hypothetical protein
MKQLAMAIETSDINLAYDLQKQTEFPGGFTVVSNEHWFGKSGPEASRIIEFVIAFSAEASAALFVAWLLNKLKGHRAQVTINRREVTLEEGEIVKVLEEEIRIDE